METRPLEEGKLNFNLNLRTLGGERGRFKKLGGSKVKFHLAN